MQETSVSGGELYRMQQEAIRRAQQTASRARQPLRPSASAPVPAPEPSCEPMPEVRGGTGGPALLGKLGSDGMVIIGLLVLLLMDGCNDPLLIIALALLAFMS